MADWKSDYLHLGCGTQQPEDWVNLDGSWNAWIAKHPHLKSIVGLMRLVPKSQLQLQWKPNVVVHDLRKPLPFNDNSMRVVYSSHTLEHLFHTQAEFLLSEIHRVLRPKGILRLVVPDLYRIAQYYVTIYDQAKYKDVPPADQFMRQLLIISEQPPSAFSLYRMYQNSKDFHRHKWMYDAHSLSRMMLRGGFVEVEQKDYLKSRIDRIGEVEIASRVQDGAGICIEGIKP
ncbi:MAG: class I SAM-dependent methyltransferase [Aggregatilineales bacterium]